MSFEKRGDLGEKSKVDFSTKKAAYFDEDGFEVVAKEDKDKLKKPVKIQKDK